MLGSARPAVLAAALALPLAPAAGLAEVDQALLAAGWDEMTFDGKAPNRYRRSAGGGVDVTSDGGISLLKMPVRVGLAETPVLSWRWQVAEPAPSADLAVQGEDDRSLAVYVAFPYMPKDASAFEQIERKIVEKTAGKEAPGRVLVYVWGGDGRRGSAVASPYMGASGRMTILRPAATPSDRWFEERIDVARDYRTLFGNEPPDPVYIAISADTDDTRSHAHGIVRDLGFTAADKAF